MLEVKGSRGGSASSLEWLGVGLAALLVAVFRGVQHVLVSDFLGDCVPEFGSGIWAYTEVLLLLSGICATTSMLAVESPS